MVETHSSYPFLSVGYRTRNLEDESVTIDQQCRNSCQESRAYQEDTLLGTKALTTSIVYCINYTVDVLLTNEGDRAFFFHCGLLLSFKMSLDPNLIDLTQKKA